LVIIGFDMCVFCKKHKKRAYDENCRKVPQSVIHIAQPKIETNPKISYNKPACKLRQNNKRNQRKENPFGVCVICDMNQPENNRRAIHEKRKPTLPFLFGKNGFQHIFSSQT